MKSCKVFSLLDFEKILKKCYPSIYDPFKNQFPNPHYIYPHQKPSSEILINLTVHCILTLYLLSCPAKTIPDLQHHYTPILHTHAVAHRNIEQSHSLSPASVLQSLSYPPARNKGAPFIPRNARARAIKETKRN